MLDNSHMLFLLCDSSFYNLILGALERGSGENITCEKNSSMPFVAPKRRSRETSSIFSGNITLI